MKFKVGDKVRVKKQLISGTDYGNFPFVNSMKEYRGKVVTIHEINPRVMAYEIAEGGANAYWTDEMLEPITDTLVTKTLERNNKPVKMISGENLLNDNDPIKPSHYRKGEMDLFEAWSKIYPANEYRAIMQAVAMRYMFRDKNNRVEDLHKAVYTIDRLIDFEDIVIKGECRMNAKKAIEILTEQRDSFLVGVSDINRSDYSEWCREKADDFTEIIKWIEENAE